MRSVAAALSRLVVGIGLGLLILGTAQENRAPAQPPAKETELDPDVVKESVDRAVEYLRASQGADGTWNDGGHAVGVTCLAGIALIEGGVRPADTAVVRAANYVRNQASSLSDTYQISLAILFLDRLRDPKRDDKLIQALAARLMGGQTATGGWTYSVTGGPRNLGRISDPETAQMLSALKKITPPPATVSVSYRERPSRIGLCIKQSEEIIVKPSQATLDAAEYEKKRVTVVNSLPANLKNRVVFQDPAKYDQLDAEDKKELIEKEKGDNSNTHFALIGLWTARRHDVPTERCFAMVARRFRASQDPSGGGWGYGYPAGASTPPMTCIGLLGLAIGNALGVDPAAARLEQDQAILKSLAYLSKNVGEPTGQVKNRPKIKDVGGLYYLWALERIAVLYDISTLDKKDWYRWGAEILISNQNQDGSWTDGGFHGGDKAVVSTPLAILFLKRANLTPDLSKRLIIDSSALTAKVNEPKPEPPPPPPPPPMTKSEPPPIIDLPKKEEPPPQPTVPPSPQPTAASSTPAPAKKESAPLWPWLVGGLALIAVIGGILILVLRKKPEDDEDDEDEDDEEDEEEKPKKKGKGKKSGSPMKAKKSKK